MEFILIILGFLAVCFGVPVFLLRHITRQHRLNPTPKIRSRFMMVDLFSLMFLVQLPITLARFSNAQLGDIHPLAFVWMLAISLLVWWAALSATNHIGVTSNLKRVVATAFTFPAAVVSGFLIWIAGSFALFGPRGWESNPSIWNQTFVVVGLVGMLVLAVEFSARWIAADNGLNSTSPSSTQRSRADI